MVKKKKEENEKDIHLHIQFISDFILPEFGIHILYA